MQKRLFSSLLVALALVLALGIVPAAVLAEEDEVMETTAASDSGRGEDTLKDELLELRHQRQEDRQHRLEANKLRVCELRKVKVQAIMTRSITRAERQLALFSTIAERVEAFYQDKGRTISNYDELVAAVNAAKADAEANLETLKNLEPFDCSAEDPKGNIEAFKLAIKSIKQDLKDFRSSVNDLIVGVKSAQGQAQREANPDTNSEQEGGEQ